MEGRKVRVGACLYVGDIDKMVHFYRDILGFSTGATITFDFGIRNFYVADPEGNLLEIRSMNEE